LSFDELHIDTIDLTWKLGARWVEGGMEAFRLARIVRDRNGPPLTVALSFSLQSGSRPRGVDFQTEREFQERLNPSPPSLCLFRTGEEPRNQMSRGGVVQDLNSSIFDIRKAGVCRYYIEFLQQNSEEYCRSVFIEG
jgi:hypothetical protein